MPAPEKRMTDLFIPVGNHRRSSSVATKSNSIARTATFSSTTTATTTPSRSTSPTTVSSRRSIGSAAPQARLNGSSSSFRYTISAPARDEDERHPRSIIDRNERVERANAVYIKRHNRTHTLPAPPIQELTMRLSRITGNRASSPKSNSNSSSTSKTKVNSKPLTPTKGGNAAGIATPTPVPSSSKEKSPSIGKVASPITYSTALSSNPPIIEGPISISKQEEIPPTFASAPHLRSHSQSSSRSDRSCPPPSFPSDFYGKNATYRGSPTKPLSRSNSARNASSSASPRSVSPLKNQLTYPESTTNATGDLGPERNQVQRSRSNSSTGSRSRSKASRVAPRPISQVSVFHVTVHEYVSCPHLSPPCTRPLDVQPQLDKSHNPPRSVIQGSCFDCDTADRRELESAILLSYNPRISSHLNDLSTIIMSLEAMSPVSPISPASAAAYFQHLSIDENLVATAFSNPRPEDPEMSGRRDSYASDISEDLDDESLLYRIQALESRVAELTHARDQEVREVWRGYTQRWGPGTQGLLRSFDSDRMNIATSMSGMSSRTSMESEQSQNIEPAEGRMRLEWIRGNNT